MEKKLNSPLIFALFTFFISNLFFISFIDAHQSKGTFWADETGVVLSSITKLRSLKQIFYDAAYTSQPPLDHIIREKIYVPLGESLGLSRQLPELFHRLPALLWWLLPLGYFLLNLKNYSFKNKTKITLGFSLLISSGFLRHYLAEARHYSAIPAVFTAMIIILLSDRVKLGQIKYQFLIISSLFPFLHLISFSYYLLFMAFFFYQIRKELKPPLVIGYALFITLVLLTYSEIKNFSSPWQHQTVENILDFRVVKSHLKWTLDWIFSGGIIYPLYKFIPEVVKNNLLSIFVVISIFLSLRLTKALIRKESDFINISNLLLFSIVLVWPVTILTTLYFSGMFSGERYSIVVIPVVLFYASWLAVDIIWRVFPTIQARAVSSLFLIALSSAVLLLDIFPLDSYNLDTPDHLFVEQNTKILKDKDAYLILDNGVYSAAFYPLAAINRTPIKVNYLQCRDGQFQTSGRNTLNDWLEEHRRSRVYLYGLYRSFMEAEKILWQQGDFVLYRLTHVPESQLCQDPNSIGDCYLKCLRGEPVSPNGRNIKGVAPNLGVYRP